MFHGVTNYYVHNTKVYLPQCSIIPPHSRHRSMNTKPPKGYHPIITSNKHYSPWYLILYNHRPPPKNYQLGGWKPSDESGIIVIKVQWDWKDPNIQNGIIGGIKKIRTTRIDKSVQSGAIWGDMEKWRQREERYWNYWSGVTTELDGKRIYGIQCK